MQSLTRPLTAQLEITDRCNFRCGHCYHLKFDCQRKSKDVSKEKVMQMIASLAENQIFSVIITGGEPLIRKDLVKSLVVYLKDGNINASLNTNLQLLDEGTLEEFVSRGLDVILASCPSSDSDIYRHMTGGADFSRFLKKLKMVIHHNQHFAVNMVVNRCNIGNIRQTAKVLCDVGVKVFGATPMGLNLENPDKNNLLSLSEVRGLVGDLLWARESLGLDIDIFEALPKCVFLPEVRSMDLSFLKRKCQAGKTVISVANNGDVRPCSHNPDVYGNILRDPLAVIWQRMSDWRDFQTVPMRCQDCKSLTNCFGGCRITAKAYGGDRRSEDPWMDEPVISINRLTKPSQQAEFKPEMSVSFSKMFQWRQEAGDNYLITSTRNNRNITVVNGQLLSFVLFLKEMCPLKLGNLANRVNRDLSDNEFQRIMHLLASKQFISFNP